MFIKVLIGVDGRDGGRDAIALAQDLGGPRAHYALANVVSGSIPGRAGAFWLTTSRRCAQSLLEDERDRAGLTADTIVVCNSSPGRALHELASGEHADLIVVGAGHRRGLPRVLLGDDALGTLDRPPCAVAVARAGYRDHPDRWTKIGVADDGSELSDRGFDVACELSHVHHASVRALSIIGPESLSYTELTLADWSAVADRIEVRRDARLHAWPGVEPEVLRGDAVERLTECSEDLDLLVVVTRGQGRIKRMLNGSTAHRLAAAVRCPLLILPPAPGPGEILPAGRTHGARAHQAPST